MSDKVLRDKPFKIDIYSQYDGYEIGLASMIYKFLDKKAEDITHTGDGIWISNNQQLAIKLHKPIIRKFKKCKVYLLYRDSIWRADLVNVQLLNKYNDWVRFCLCVIDIYSKYAWFVPLKDKKGITFTYTFQKILGESGCKPNKILVD